MAITQLNAAQITLDYATKVLKGELIAGNLVHLACARFLNDLKNGKERGIYFCPVAAQKAVNFFSELHHWIGKHAGKPFILLPWEVFIVSNIFGWLHIKTKLRRYREAYIEVARKNGKSHLAAGIGLYMLVADNEPGALVVAAAVTEKQTKEVFIPAQKMIQSIRGFAKEGIKLQRAAITVEKTNSSFITVSSEAGSLEGKNIQCAVVDELHRHKTDEVYNVLRKGMLARSQPLFLAITTAGVYNPTSICWLARELAVKVLMGTIKEPLVTDRMFTYIATLDKDDLSKWDDEKIWIKANPSLNEAWPIEELRPLALAAKESAFLTNDFKTKNLNIWCEQKEAWLAPDVWEKNSSFPDDAEHRPTALREMAKKKLEGRSCYVGLDMGETSDFTALAQLFPPCEQVTAEVDDPNNKGKKLKVILQEADPKWSILVEHFYPQESIYEQDKKIPGFYSGMARAGFINVVDGPCIDPDAIRNTMREIRKKYRLISCGYDRAGAHEYLAPTLQKDGIQMVAIPQRYENMSLQTQKLMGLLQSGLMEHYNDPLLIWQSSNTQLLRDSNGNIRPDKGKSGNKIDGIVALVMAMGQAMANPNPVDNSPDRYKIKWL